MMRNLLLERYVAERSEAAFAELVGQHIDLVYSAALRQVNGDSGAAQDVAQTVFAELAQKAPRLVNHTSLVGWLYTSTRYTAAKARRTEQRRTAREQEAFAMNQLLQTTEPDPAWEALRPALDEAMHDLSNEDRIAVLLRYFEKRPLSEIGTRLGLSEDAARKRVARALEKLRERLNHRGITSTVAALSIALAERAVTAAPVEIAGRISKKIAATGGLGAGGIALVWKLLIGAASVAVLTCAIALSKQTATPQTHSPTASMPTASVRPIAATPVTMNPPAAVKTEPSIDNDKKLILQIVTADSGKAIPSVVFDYWIYTSNNCWHKSPLTASPAGMCEVPVPDGTTQLILVSEREGFADTRLRWRPDHGQEIPAQYVLRLVRGAAVGGTIVDTDGNPIADAEVGFNNHIDPSLDLAQDTDNFEWPYWITVKSDKAGRWQTSRVAKESIRTLAISTSHPTHVGSYVETDKLEVQQQLLAGKYEIRMSAGAEVTGRVVDENGHPLPGARINVDGDRSGNASADGSFRVEGCNRRKAVLTAVADGFAPREVETDLRTNAGPYTLVLQPGKLLRLKVVDAAGAPISGAHVWLNNYRPDDNGAIEPAPHIDFDPRTDAAGRVIWTGAPNYALSYDIYAPGYMRASGQAIKADGGEHVVTLMPTLTVSGTVRDAATGDAIPHFRLVAGWPVTNLETKMVSGNWSSINRFWEVFENGKFQKSWEEPVLGGTPNPGYIFKIEAKGYAPFVTRPVAMSENNVVFDIEMQPAKGVVVSVLLPDGTPAGNIDVGLILPNAGLQLVPGGFSKAFRQSGGTMLTTDSAGNFTLSADSSVKSVVAASKDGFVEMSRTDLMNTPQMVMQPWGKLEGNLKLSGQPAAQIPLLFDVSTSAFRGISSEFFAFQVKTDDSGHFIFPQVPGGRHQLTQLLWIKAMPRPTGYAWEHVPLTNVEIIAGETTTVEVNGVAPLASK